MAVEGRFDTSEIEKFNEELVKLAQVEFPRETKAFMRKEATAFNKLARADYRSETKKKTGKLLKGLVKGSPYLYNGDEYQIRVKNIAPHAHLIEYGHGIIKTKAGINDKIPIGAAVVHLPSTPVGEINVSKINFRNKIVPGKHIMGETDTKFKSAFPNDVDKFIDEMLEKGLK